MKRIEKYYKAIFMTRILNRKLRDGENTYFKYVESKDFPGYDIEVVHFSNSNEDSVSVHTSNVPIVKCEKVADGVFKGTSWYMGDTPYNVINSYLEGKIVLAD